MQVFSTDFPVSASSTVDTFFELVRRWLPSVPRTALTAESLDRIGKQAQGTLSTEQESLEWLLTHDAQGHQAGIRYIRKHQPVEERTTLVYSASSRGAWLSIRVEQQSPGTTVQLPPSRTPLLMRTVLSSPLAGARDGHLPVNDLPYRLTHSDIDLAAQLMRGESGSRLPVIYVSAQFGGGYLVDTEHLARELGGIAHVVLEPDRQFSNRLRMSVNGRNVYGGSIGLYWPERQGQFRRFYLGHLFSTPEVLTQAVIDSARNAVLNRQPPAHCTWASLHDASTRQALQSLKDAGSTNLDDYIQTFDREIVERDRQLQELAQENQRLQRLLTVQESRLGSMQGTLLQPGQEKELYPDEFSAILLDALKDALARTLPDTRRRHVLASLIDANPLPDHPADRHREQLKSLLRGMRGLTPKVRRGLEDMGFAIHENGKHAKLVYSGDDRYTYTLPSSGSDWRGGLNAANDIARLLF